MKIIKVPLKQIKNWDKNPRAIKKDDFARLKKQISKLGIYKPMVAYEDKGSYIVLGGNMRLRALKELGYEEAELSIVNPVSEAEKIEYALSDNDRAGYYEEQALQELAFQYKDDLQLDDYKIDLGNSETLQDIIDKIKPTDANELNNSILKTEYEVIIECKDEIEQKLIYNKLIKEGYICRVLAL